MYKRQYFNLHFFEIIWILRVLFRRVVNIEVATDSHKHLVLEKAPNLWVLVGNCSLVNTDTTLVKDLYHIVTFQGHVVDEVVVN